MSNFIMGKVKELQNQIIILQEEILKLQKSCSHPKEAVSEKAGSNTGNKAGSNTGNYDPSADRYWIDYHCHICDKCWFIEL